MRHFLLIATITFSNPVFTQPVPDPVSDSVGATVGQFTVDEQGSASYSIPIFSVPGTAGVAPKMELIYNSQGSSGILGKGFSLSGTSAISRCRQTIESGDFLGVTGNTTNFNPRGLNFTNSDRFCLDGQRLLVTSGAYGASGSEYRPETDPYTLVFARGGENGSGANYTGPSYFEVHRRDGSTAFYGNTIDSNVRRSGCDTGGVCATSLWAMNRSQDSSGNYMDLTYQQNPAAGSVNTGEYVLVRVDYTGKVVLPGQTGSALSPYARIEFSYDTRPENDWERGFQAGAQLVQSQQLREIRSYGPDDNFADTLVRAYTFAYDQSFTFNGGSGSAAYRLKSVTECGSDGTTCYRPTLFTWSSAQNSFSTQENSASFNGPIARSI